MDPRTAELSADVVACLIREQFPGWAELPIRPVELGGWDNTTFRLGEEMSVRLPNDDAFVAQVEKEHRWLPVIARHVPVPVPTPRALGVPGCGYPRPWSIYRWLDGVPAALTRVHDLDRLADDLAEFLLALQQVPTPGGPVPGPHNYQRGGPIDVFDQEVRVTIAKLSARIDTIAALGVWDAALQTRYRGRDLWVHGDMTGSNFLIRNDRLCGVIDFGCAAIGDPACDLTPAWTMFEGSSRRRFMDALPVDAASWDRARGWALWKAIKTLPTLPEDHPRNDGRRLGWRRPSLDIVEEITSSFRSTG